VVSSGGQTSKRSPFITSHCGREPKNKRPKAKPAQPTYEGCSRGAQESRTGTETEEKPTTEEAAGTSEPSSPQKTTAKAPNEAAWDGWHGSIRESDTKSSPRYLYLPPPSTQKNKSSQALDIRRTMPSKALEQQVEEKKRSDQPLFQAQRWRWIASVMELETCRTEASLWSRFSYFSLSRFATRKWT
jgi:hypothetical protein